MGNLIKRSMSRHRDGPLLSVDGEWSRLAPGSQPAELPEQRADALATLRYGSLRDWSWGSDSWPDLNAGPAPCELPKPLLLRLHATLFTSSHPYFKLA